MAKCTGVVDEKKEGFLLNYSEISQEELKETIDNGFRQMGYQLIEGSPCKGTYEKGNRGMRLLLGGFSKYFKFQANTFQEENGDVRLKIMKATSGMSGGIIGMNQVKQEFKNLKATFQSI